MGEWRTEWQKYKRTYPIFDRLKADKKNLGPMLDEHEKFCAEIVKDMRELEKAIAGWWEAREKLYASYLVYEGVIKELAKTDKTIGADFYEAFNTPRHINVAYMLKRKFLPSAARV